MLVGVVDPILRTTGGLRHGTNTPSSVRWVACVGSSFVDCNVSISMVKGLRTTYKDEHDLALLQLGWVPSLVERME